MRSIGFVAGTPVLTPGGLVPIESVGSGTEVVAATPDGQGTVTCRVLDAVVDHQVPLVHLLYETERMDFLVCGWRQLIYAQSAESWVWGVETPGWVEAAEAPIDIFLHCATPDRARLLQAAMVVRSSVPTRGFLQPSGMDQATGAWLDLSGDLPKTIPHPGFLANPRAQGLVLNDLDVDLLPVEQRSFRSNTYSLVLPGPLGYFVGATPVLTAAHGGA